MYHTLKAELKVKEEDNCVACYGNPKSLYFTILVLSIEIEERIEEKNFTATNLKLTIDNEIQQHVIVLR